MQLVVLSAIPISARLAAAETTECRSVDVDLTPTADLQIVAWIEDAAGHYVDTALITQATGLRGLGNRTGIMGLKSGPMWPYGAREDVLPIWAHRHGLTFPAVNWQSDRGCDVQTLFADSSPEGYYSRPMSPTEPQWDAGTGASNVFTDKGAFTERSSLYPPRADLVRTQQADQPTAASTEDYAGYSDIDGVVHVPDATITADTPGSGASRLRVAIAPDSSTYRVHVATHPEQDSIAPAAPTELQVTTVEPTHAELSFVAPGDDGSIGTVAGYDIRYTIGDSLDGQSFDSATPYPNLIFRVAGGQVQTLAFDGLLPYTPYVVGIRAYDNCKHYGPLVIARFETPTAEVSACGCHTADPGIALALLAFRRRRRTTGRE